MKFDGYSDNEVVEFTLPYSVVTELTHLEGVVDDYLAYETNDVLYVPADMVRFSRLREKGVISANKKMIECKSGQRSRRKPPEVFKHPLETGAFVVRDGNSTVCNLVISGFPTIPVFVVQR